MNANGTSLLSGTFLGGSGFESGADSWDSGQGALHVDPEGNVYISGHTNSTDFPTTSNAYQRTLQGQSDIFVVKMDSNLSRIEYSSLLGGSAYERGHDIKVDPWGNIFTVGRTNSTDFPVTGDLKVSAITWSSRGGERGP